VFFYVEGGQQFPAVKDRELHLQETLKARRQIQGLAGMVKRTRASSEAHLSLDYFLAEKKKAQNKNFDDHIRTII
jgi:hypothetical protein